LTKEEIQNLSGVKGKQLGGAVSAFSQRKGKDKLLKHDYRGYSLNNEYRDIIGKVASEYGLI